MIRSFLITSTVLVLLYSAVHIQSFSIPDDRNKIVRLTTPLWVTDGNDEVVQASTQRRLFWQVPLGAVGLYAYGKLANTALSSSGSIIYPSAHESRVSSTIAMALTAAAKKQSKPTLRVLEVGVGKDARLIRRGLYDEAIHQLASASSAPYHLEFTGLDIRLPREKAVIDDVTAKLQSLRSTEGVSIDWELCESSIEQINEQFTDGYFDAVICCLTLCSVDNQLMALQEIKRLLRPSGGTFGYIEHVAVDETMDDKHRFLAIQQQLLDPLQQLLVDNCHLHRRTEQAVEQAFQASPFRRLAQESFYVDNMWPVSCQACGVLQLV
jgi:ubiquinone/menaquinone biosynthesis C-methylase UbiE